eukprot:snap_masked-scaffold_38-processed-gene-0.6-mRNA-1 protein AED:1.00 eAED:1.00 QI:0/-1/0/0/-1/1/1/0/400
MRQTCFGLFPAGKCGFQGSCVVVNSSGNTTIQEKCVCEPGWSQSKEMSLFFLGEDDIDVNQVGLCTENKSLLSVLYFLALFTAVIGFIYQTSKITKKKHVVKLFPLLCGVGMEIFLCLYKLVSFEQANLGDDPLFSAFVANTVLLYLASVLIFFNRYIFYILKRTQLGNQGLVKKANFFSKMSKHIFFSDFIIYQMLWLSVLMPRKIGFNVIRIFLAMTLFRTFYTLFMVHTLFGTLIRDIRLFLTLEKPRYKITHNAAIAKSMEFAKKGLVGLRFLRLVCYFYGFVFFVYGFLPSVFPFLLYTLGYQVPLIFLIWNIIFIAAAYTRRKRRSISTSGTKLKTKTGLGSTFENVRKKTHFPFTSPEDMNTENLVVSQIETLPFSNDKDYVYQPRYSQDNSI